MIFQEYILHHLQHLVHIIHQGRRCILLLFLLHRFIHHQCKGTIKPVLMLHHLQLVILWNMVLNTTNSHLLLQKKLSRGVMDFAQDGNWAFVFFFFFPFYLNNDSLCTYLFIYLFHMWHSCADLCCCCLFVLDMCF